VPFYDYQSHKTLIIKEIATAHMRLAMTESGFFKGLSPSIPRCAGLRFTPALLDQELRMEGIRAGI